MKVLAPSAYQRFQCQSGNSYTSDANSLITTAVNGDILDLLNMGCTIDNLMLNDVTTVTISSAELLALNATPKTIIAAPGANLAIVPRLVAVRHAGGTAYAGIAAGEDLVLKYTNGSGAQCSSVIETTGFLDQTSAQIRFAGPPASTGSTPGDFAPVANAAVVAHLLVGEITTGNFPLIVRCWYDIVPTNFS